MQIGELANDRKTKKEENEKKTNKTQRNVTKQMENKRNK
jgi:hypothetical protein